MYVPYNLFCLVADDAFRSKKSGVKLVVHNLGEKKMMNTERTTLPMQKVHSEKSDWSYAQDTSNGDAVHWHNSVLQRPTAY
jgi:hypothetical protein